MRLYDSPIECGVLVVSLEPDSRARRVSALEGALIIGFGGRSVAGIDDLDKALTEERARRQVPLEVIRLTGRLMIHMVPEEFHAQRKWKE